MGLILRIEEESRPVIEDLCSRIRIKAKWSTRRGGSVLELEGEDDEGRFVLRRLQALGIPFEIDAIDGKELLPAPWR